jgi:hypothetical protein
MSRYHGYGVLKQDGVVVSSNVHYQLQWCDTIDQVHEGKFVRGSYGQVGAADEGTSTSGSDEEDRAALTEDEVTLTGVKSSNPKPVAGGTVGIRAAAAAPSSPPFVNPYSLRAAVGDTTLFSSSDSDSFPSSPPSATKVLPTALQPSLKLPALHTLHAQGDVGGGPLLSGYDSWSEDDADAGGGSGTADDDDWSDIENPQQAAPNTHALHKLKLAPVAAFAPLDSASPSDSAAQRVEVWAARHAGGGLLGLMLNMRRCDFPSRVCVLLSHVANVQCVGRSSPRCRPSPHAAVDRAAGAVRAPGCVVGPDAAVAGQTRLHEYAAARAPRQARGATARLCGIVLGGISRAEGCV